MKFLTLFLACSIFTMTARAATSPCPADSKVVKNCLSTPQKGDAEIAAQTFDSIAICQKGKAIGLAFTKNGEQSVGDAKVISRTGGASYSVKLDDTEFSLSTIVNGKQSNNATFSINFLAAKVKASSTYSCK